MMVRPAVDFPQPDSPTSPSVSPGIKSKLIPATAWFVPSVFVKIDPELIGKCLVNPWTERSGAGIVGLSLNDSGLNETCRYLLDLAS